MKISYQGFDFFNPCHQCAPGPGEFRLDQISQWFCRLNLTLAQKPIALAFLSINSLNLAGGNQKLNLRISS